MSEDEAPEEGASNMASKYCMAGFKLMYHGLPTEDFDEFCRQFDAHATLANFTGDKQKLSFQTRLAGNALVFFNTLSEQEKATLTTIKRALKSNFEGDSWKWQLETKLLSRKQVLGESIDDYAADIIKMATQLTKNDSDQISFFVRGLLPPIRAFVFSKEPKTLKEAIDSARLGVVVDSTSKEGTTPAVSSIQGESQQGQIDLNAMINDSVINALSSYRDRPVNQNRGQQFNESRRRRRSYANQSYHARGGAFPRNSTRNSNAGMNPHIVCHRCYEQGHIRRHCTSLYDIYGNSLN